MLTWEDFKKLKLFLKPQLTFQDGVGVPLASLQVKFPIQLVTDLKPRFRGFFYLSIEKWALTEIGAVVLNFYAH